MKFKQPATAVFTFVLFTLAFLSSAWADNDPIAKLTSLVETLQKQVVQMQDTINQQSAKIRNLESREPRLEVAEPGGVEAKDPEKEKEAFGKNLSEKIGDSDKWLKNLKFSGDFRLRYEAFDFTSGHPSETDSRNRFRYRLRYGFEKKFNDDMKAGFSLASGETGTGNDVGLNVDPTSTNQTFDNNFNFKDIFIERAYAIYSPSWAKIHPMIEKVEVGGGKVANPFEQGSSDLVWDRDVRPEGAYEMIRVRLYDGEEVKVKAYGLAGQFILDEDSSASDHSDSELYAWQAGLETSVLTPAFEKPVTWLTAASYFNYSDFAENSNFLIGSTSLARGNSNFEGAGTELDADEFDVIEFYNELTLNPFPFMEDVPLKPFVDFAHNVTSNVTTQDDETWAWSFGAKVGGIKKKGDWEIGYAYKRIENNSVVGAFDDGDFGLGFSGKRGSQFKLGYALTDSITLNAAAFFVNNLATGTGGVLDEEQRRFQADVSWKL